MIERRIIPEDVKALQRICADPTAAPVELRIGDYGGVTGMRGVVRDAAVAGQLVRAYEESTGRLIAPNQER